MKKKNLFFCGMCMLVLYSGCGQENIQKTEKSKEPPKTISVAITPMEKETSVKSAKSRVINESDGFPIPLDIEIDSDACNAMNRKLTTESDSGASLFCLDKNEVIYFVNQNNDNYLYCRKDGVTELAAALPAKELYPWEDRIYFMIAAKTGEKEAGDIYEYIPATKQVKLVYALGTLKGGENHKMTVDEQGIHFRYSETIVKEDGTTNIEEYSYTLVFGAEEPQESDRITGTNENISSAQTEVYQYCAVGNTVYSIELGSSAVSYINLQTQKKGRYNFRTGIINANSYLKDDIERVFGEGKKEILSFTTTENGKIIWVTDGTYLYRMDCEIAYAFQIKTSDETRRIETLYTDGRSVYGLYSSEKEGKLQLVRFCTEVLKQERVDFPAIAEVEYLIQKIED